MGSNLRGAIGPGEFSSRTNFVYPSKGTAKKEGSLRTPKSPFRFAVSRILWTDKNSVHFCQLAIIHLGCILQYSSGDQPESRPKAGQVLSYLILLRAEFGCFHSGSSFEISRSRSRAQCPGHSLCSTVPHLTVGGRYPLRCPVESGLSSPGLLPKRLPTNPKFECCITVLDEALSIVIAVLRDEYQID